MTRSILTLTALLLVPSAALAEGDDNRSYGYFSALEGTASLVGSDGQRAEAELNLPVIPGDTLSLGLSSRAELVLPDGSVLRSDGGTELTLVRIAWSAGVEDVDTALQLPRGELLLTLAVEAPETTIATPNATLYLRSAGLYRVTAEGFSTRVLVREGRAELSSDRGSTVVLAGEEALVSGRDTPRTTISAAPPQSSLERWAARRDSDSQWRGTAPIDEDLRYAAAPLERHGSWVDVDGTSAWRPAGVAVDWTPYRDGRWVDTRVGYTWVSYEPWGWVPYHYGSWDLVPGWGWVWYPGRRWAPAHVVWYWGPQYVGWCPTGWYGRRYGSGVNININLNFGVYGWAHGRTRDWHHWRFVDYDGFRDRRLARHTRSGASLAASGIVNLERGVLATDSRPVVRARRLNGAEVQHAWDRELRSAGRTPDSLPDVSALATRSPRIDATTRAALEKPVRIAPDPTLRGTARRVDDRPGRTEAAADRTPSGGAWGATGGERGTVPTTSATPSRPTATRGRDGRSAPVLESGGRSPVARPGVGATTERRLPTAAEKPRREQPEASGERRVLVRPTAPSRPARPTPDRESPPAPTTRGALPSPGGAARPTARQSTPDRERIARPSVSRPPATEPTTRTREAAPRASAPVARPTVRSTPSAGSSPRSSSGTREVARPSSRETPVQRVIESSRRAPRPTSTAPSPSTRSSAGSSARPTPRETGSSASSSNRPSSSQSDSSARRSSGPERSSASSARSSGSSRSGNGSGRSARSSRGSRDDD